MREAGACREGKGSQRAIQRCAAEEARHAASERRGRAVPNAIRACMRCAARTTTVADGTAVGLLHRTTRLTVNQSINKGRARGRRAIKAGR